MFKVEEEHLLRSMGTKRHPFVGIVFYTGVEKTASGKGGDVTRHSPVSVIRSPLYLPVATGECCQMCPLLSKESLQN